jgi:transcriptional regulator with XRE-family HTH domain
MSELLSLRELRKERRITQTELAVAIGTSIGSIVAWENKDRRPREYHMRALAEFYEVPEEDIDVAPFRPGGRPSRTSDYIIIHRKQRQASQSQQPVSAPRNNSTGSSRGGRPQGTDL